MTERQQDAPGEPKPNGEPEEPIEDATQADPNQLAESGAGPAADEAEGAAEAEAAEDEEAGEAEVEEAAEDATEEATAPIPVAPPPGRSSRGRPTDTGRLGRPVTTPGPTPSDQAVHIDDRVSKAFVLVAVAVFAIIFANAMLLGKGGTFAAPSPSPSEAASESPATSESPSPGGSGATSASPGASESANPAASASPGASESPTSSGAAAPSVAPSPSS